MLAGDQTARFAFLTFANQRFLGGAQLVLATSFVLTGSNFFRGENQRRIDRCAGLRRIHLGGSSSGRRQARGLRRAVARAAIVTVAATVVAVVTTAVITTTLTSRFLRRVARAGSLGLTGRTGLGGFGFRFRFRFGFGFHFFGFNGRGSSRAGRLDSGRRGRRHGFDNRRGGGGRCGDRDFGLDRGRRFGGRGVHRGRLGGHGGGYGNGRGVLGSFFFRQHHHALFAHLHLNRARFASAVGLANLGGFLALEGDAVVYGAAMGATQMVAQLGFVLFGQHVFHRRLAHAGRAQLFKEVIRLQA